MEWWWWWWWWWWWVVVVVVVVVLTVCLTCVSVHIRQRDAPNWVAEHLPRPDGGGTPGQKVNPSIHELHLWSCTTWTSTTIAMYCRQAQKQL